MLAVHLHVWEDNADRIDGTNHGGGMATASPKHTAAKHRLPVQVVPSPEYPGRQVQVRDPGVLVHVAAT